jgi:hypothetical protein
VREGMVASEHLRLLVYSLPYCVPGSKPLNQIKGTRCVVGWLDERMGRKYCIRMECGIGLGGLYPLGNGICRQEAKLLVVEKKITNVLV